MRLMGMKIWVCCHRGMEDGESIISRIPILDGSDPEALRKSFSRDGGALSMVVRRTLEGMDGGDHHSSTFANFVGPSEPPSETTPTGDP